MIEFKGYLSGSAERRHFNRSIAMPQYIALVSLLIGVLNYTTLLKMARIWPPFIAVAAVFYGLCLLSPLWLRIPLLKKENLVKTPVRISIVDDYIICVAGKFEEGRQVQEVRQVRDHGEFYELVFPLGRGDYHFICQKSLLTQGSLEEFEQLFEGKLVSVK